MNDRVIELEEYKNSLKNKKCIDTGEITTDDLSLEELEDVSKLYRSEINSLSKEIKEINEENKVLRKLLEK